MEADRRAVRPVPPHDRHLLQGTGRTAVDVRPQHQRVQELRPEQGEAVHRVQPRRILRRRCHPVRLRGRRVQPGGPAGRAELGGLPCRDGGDYRVTVTRDERSIANDGRRLTFRYQLNGPATHKIVERATGTPLPRIKFFAMGDIEIAGVPHPRAQPHHGRGVPGLEFTGLELVGPSEHGEKVLDAADGGGRSSGSAREARGPTRPRPSSPGGSPPLRCPPSTRARR